MPGTTQFLDLMDQVFHLGRDWARLMRSQSLTDYLASSLGTGPDKNICHVIVLNTSN